MPRLYGPVGPPHIVSASSGIITNYGNPNCKCHMPTRKHKRYFCFYLVFWYGNKSSYCTNTGYNVGSVTQLTTRLGGGVGHITAGRRGGGGHHGPTPPRRSPSGTPRSTSPCPDLHRARPELGRRTAAAEGGGTGRGGGQKGENGEDRVLRRRGPEASSERVVQKSREAGPMTGALGDPRRCGAAATGPDGGTVPSAALVDAGGTSRCRTAHQADSAGGRPSWRQRSRQTPALGTSVQPGSARG